MKIPLKEYLQLLSAYLRPQWRAMAALALLLLGSTGLQLANPQIMRRFIDNAGSGAPPGMLSRLAFLFVGVTVVQQAVSVIAAGVGENVGWTATNGLRAAIADHCLRLDMSFHGTHTPGEMIERLEGDVTALAGFFSQCVIQVLGSLLLLLGIMLFLFREGRDIGMALGAFALLSLLMLLWLRNIAVARWAASREAHAGLFGFLEERLSGAEDIRANGARPYVMSRFFGLMRDVMRMEVKAGLMTNVMVTSSNLVWSVGPAAAFALGAYALRAGRISLGSVYLIFNYTAMLLLPIQRITQQLQALQKASAGIARIRGLLQTPTRILDGAGVSLPAGALEVEFRAVSFAYGEGEAVLSDLSFRLAPGRVLGLLGRTGSGKTTLTRLLLRLYDAQEGSICLGGADIRQARLRELRQRVGMVTQNVELFHATVRDNLTFFDPSVPDKQVLEVIRQLGLGPWFRALPRGLDTELESGGAGLSTGEAQLLAFTRIFLRNPGLVVLDEASSRLDPATERLVERAVDALLRGRTGIIIAHRLATVQRADEIMIVEGGRIREYGPRRELASDPASRYRRLLEAGLQEMLA